MDESTMDTQKMVHDATIQKNRKMDATETCKEATRKRFFHCYLVGAFREQGLGPFVDASLDQRHVLHVAVGLEELVATVQLRNDAAHGPNVAGEGPRQGHDHFGGAVLAGGNQLGLVLVVIVSRAPEVDELDPRALGDPHLLFAHLLHRELVGHQQHVFGLQIGVHL